MENSINFDDLKCLIKDIEHIEKALEKQLQLPLLENTSLANLYGDISVALCNFKNKDLNYIELLWSSLNPAHS